MMGTVLLMWGVFVRIYIVQKWPEETVGSEFSWQRLYYCVDAIVFYAAVRRCCLFCIYMYMPAIDRSLSDCRCCSGRTFPTAGCA